MSTDHAPRLSLPTILPAAYAAMAELDRSAHEHLDARTIELVKLRVSQVNGCAYCLDMHACKLRDELGESQQRLDVLAAWREVPFFDERERAALALAESVTRLGEGGVPDEVWDAAAAVFDERELACLLTAAIAINAWNRVAIPTRTAVAESP